jgi:hypothetical protein
LQQQQQQEQARLLTGIWRRGEEKKGSLRERGSRDKQKKLQTSSIEHKLGGARSQEPPSYK